MPLSELDDPESRGAISHWESFSPLISIISSSLCLPVSCSKVDDSLRDFDKVLAELATHAGA